jgi:hypothetical protein
MRHANEINQGNNDALRNLTSDVSNLDDLLR